MKRRDFVLTLAATGAAQAQDIQTVPFHSVGEGRPAWFYESEEAEVLIDPADFPQSTGLYDAVIHIKKDWDADTIILTAFFKTARILGADSEPTELWLTSIATAPYVGLGAGSGIDKPLHLEAKPERVDLKLLKTVGVVKLKL